MIKFLFLLLSVLCSNKEVPCDAQETQEFIPDCTSAIVYEGSTDTILYEKNIDNKIQLSHFTKLMTLLIASEKIEDGTIKLTDTAITSNHANSMGDPQIWLNVGEKITVDELIKSITVGNANDAAVVLAEYIAGTEDKFVSMMNEKAVSLGLLNTTFKDCTGIDIDANFSTVYDMALLAKEISKYDFLIPYLTTWMTNVRNDSANLVNSNKLVKNLSGYNGLKACTTPDLKHNAITTVNKNDMNLICIIIGSSDSDKRFDDTKQLIKQTVSAYEIFVPEINDIKNYEVGVRIGQKDKVGITIEKDTSLIIPRGSASKVETKVTVYDSVCAPVKKGDIVGCIQYFSDDYLVMQTNIVANEDVKKIDFLYAFNKLVDYILN